MIRAKYIGPVDCMKDQTALVKFKGVSVSRKGEKGNQVKEDCVLVQFDDFHSPYSHGWHEFEKSDFEFLEDGW